MTIWQAILAYPITFLGMFGGYALDIWRWGDKFQWKWDAYEPGFAYCQFIGTMGGMAVGVYLAIKYGKPRVENERICDGQQGLRDA
jgi:hypothetical protein